MTEAVFVAGASGVLGRRVVPALVAAGYAVTANVRNEAARRAAAAAGAATATIDLFDASATGRLGDEHDAVVNVATSIPTGFSATRRSGWAMNDRLRTVASANLAAAVARPAGRYVGESITFPYVDSGAEWIDESVERTYFWGNTSCVDAEAAASNVTNAGGHGVALRFAMSLPLTARTTRRSWRRPVGGSCRSRVSSTASSRGSTSTMPQLRWSLASALPPASTTSRNPTRSGGPTMPVRSHARPVGVVSGHSRSRPSSWPVPVSAVSFARSASRRRR